MILDITLLCLCLVASAFFSASETSLMSVNRIRLRHLVENNVKNAKATQDLIDSPTLLGSILIGNNMVNIGASAIATSLAIQIWNKKGVGIATVFMTVVILIFGEITPKSIAVEFSEKIALKITPFMRMLVKIFTPIVMIFNLITKLFLKLFGDDVKSKKPFITEEELKTMVEVSTQEGVLESDEKEMIDNIFEFGDLRVSDVMVQRMDIMSIDVNEDFNAVVKAFGPKKFSRLPVYEDTIDNIIGVLYAKDLFFISEDERKKFDIKKYMRTPIFTYEFIKISDFFKEMQGEQVHMAIALDEYGGVAGIITMEDIIESILGDINDEYDVEDDSEIVFVKDNEYVIKGNVRLEDINETVGTNLESEDFESIGGLILGYLGKLPKTGEVIKYGNLKFVIEKVDKSRIMKVRLFK